MLGVFLAFALVASDTAAIAWWSFSVFLARARDLGRAARRAEWHWTIGHFHATVFFEKFEVEPKAPQIELHSFTLCCVLKRPCWGLPAWFNNRAAVSESWAGAT